MKCIYSNFSKGKTICNMNTSCVWIYSKKVVFFSNVQSYTSVYRVAATASCISHFLSTLRAHAVNLVTARWRSSWECTDRGHDSADTGWVYSKNTPNLIKLLSWFTTESPWCDLSVCWWMIWQLFDKIPDKKLVINNPRKKSEPWEVFWI